MGSVASLTRTKYSLKRTTSLADTMSDTRKHARSPSFHTHDEKPLSCTRAGRKRSIFTRVRSGIGRPGAGRTTYVTWWPSASRRSEEHTSELQSLRHLVCRLLLEKKKKTTDSDI